MTPAASVTSAAYFTLAVSAATPERCAALTDRARITDPRIMPIAGPPSVVWQSPDGRAAMLRWGSAHGNKAAGENRAPASRAGTIWAEPDDVAAGRFGLALRARTSLARVDPVYVAEVPGAVILSDRAMWAAAVADRLAARDPRHVCALLNPGFPLGSVTPFAGVRALDGATALEAAAGVMLARPAGDGDGAGWGAPAPGAAADGARGGGEGPAEDGAGGSGLDYLFGAPVSVPVPPGEHEHGPGAWAGPVTGLAAGAALVAAALTEAVEPLRAVGSPVELSLTGGKDSRLIAAALTRAGVAVRARTHGFAGHPDVVAAAEIARRLGIEHVVRTPAAPEAKIDVATRLRATVLVADGMLSAFENVGRPDPAASPAVTAGGHGGELLRGGYAETAAGSRHAAGAVAYAKRAARATEMLRRLTTRRITLLRPGGAASYLASLSPWSTAALAHGPVQALDDFYLVNRAGRWSAAARQAYLLREHLVQPLFDDRVVRAARAVPLADRMSGALSGAVLAELNPALADVPLAGKSPAGTAGGQAAAATFDWRRHYGAEIAGFLRDYTLDLGTTGGLFDVVSRAAAERLLTPPHSDRAAAWALATLACLLSGDYRNARERSPMLSVS